MEEGTFNYYMGMQSCVQIFLKEIRYVYNLWPDMYRQGGCGQLDQGIVDNSNGRQSAPCGLLGVVLAKYWATVRHNSYNARPSQKSKVLWEMRPEESKFSWHFTVIYLPI